ncbi:MAG: hypothetical protein JKY86_05900 [Gammaproteobacteria bacterium]|nr:hypothetical protein [Gammaproteobacteria bacterium]
MYWLSLIGLPGDSKFSEKPRGEATWKADRLTFDEIPPAYFGRVEFEGGGELMMDFTRPFIKAVSTYRIIFLYWNTRFH